MEVWLVCDLVLIGLGMVDIGLGKVPIGFFKCSSISFGECLWMEDV